jgi:hypothetical protein
VLLVCSPAGSQKTPHKLNIGQSALGNGAATFVADTVAMAKVLYIDFLSSDGAVGITKNRRSISLNFSLLEPGDRINDFLFAAGKYVCLIEGNQNAATQMLFLDARRHGSWMKHLASHPIIAPHATQHFQSAVEFVNRRYDQVAATYALSLEEPS